MCSSQSRDGVSWLAALLFSTQFAFGEERVTRMMAEAPFQCAAKFDCLNLCQKSIKLEIREDEQCAVVSLEMELVGLLQFFSLPNLHLERKV